MDQLSLYQDSPITDSYFALDNSALSTYCQCQRKFYLESVLRRTSATHRVATDIGSAVHEVFEMLLKNQDYSRAIVKWQKTIYDGFGETGDLKNDSARADAIAKFHSAVSLLVENYPIVFDTNEVGIVFGLNKKDNSTFPRWIIRHSEQPFLLPLREAEPYYRIMGKIDCIVEDANGLLYLLELKTSGSASSFLWKENFHITSQLKTYLWAAQQIFSKPIAGAIVIPLQMNKRSAILEPEIIIEFNSTTLENWHLYTSDLIQEIQVKLNSKLDYNYFNAEDKFIPTGFFNKTCASKDFGKCFAFDYCRSNFNRELLEQLTEENTWNPLA